MRQYICTCHSPHVYERDRLHVGFRAGVWALTSKCLNQTRAVYPPQAKERYWSPWAIDAPWMHSNNTFECCRVTGLKHRPSLAQAIFPLECAPLRCSSVLPRLYMAHRASRTFWRKCVRTRENLADTSLRNPRRWNVELGNKHCGQGHMPLSRIVATRILEFDC